MIKKRCRKWLFTAACIFVVLGCQKDDICTPETATTPLLVIEFYDVQEPTLLKAVGNLAVRAAGREDNIIGPITGNKISLPLRTTENFTEFILTRNAGTENENEDRVTVSYTPSPEYISRACGFKVQYLNIDVAIHSDDDNWLVSSTIIQENIENETAAHISFTL